jgi:hypothetical protein
LQLLPSPVDGEKSASLLLVPEDTMVTSIVGSPEVSRHRYLWQLAAQQQQRCGNQQPCRWPAARAGQVRPVAMPMHLLDRRRAPPLLLCAMQILVPDIRAGSAIIQEIDMVGRVCCGEPELALLKDRKE